MTCGGPYDDVFTCISLLSLEIMNRSQIFAVVVDLVEAISGHDIRSYHNLIEMHSIPPCLSLLLGGPRAVKQVSIAARLYEKSILLFNEYIQKKRS